MRCPKCGHENARGAASCGGCKGRFVRKRAKTMKEPVTALLLEWGRRADETESERP